MMHVLWTENDLSAATDDIGCTERSLSDWIDAINGITPMSMLTSSHTASQTVKLVGCLRSGMSRTLGYAVLDADDRRGHRDFLRSR